MQAAPAPIPHALRAEDAPAVSRRSAGSVPARLQARDALLQEYMSPERGQSVTKFFSKLNNVRGRFSQHGNTWSDGYSARAYRGIRR